MESYDPMEVFYQRKCANYIYVTPEGLRELMSDISREVIRCNPKHIYSFIADYLDALLITRENARVACKIVDNLVESSILVTQLLSQLKISKYQAERAALIIQRAFRKYKKRRTSEDEQLDQSKLIMKLRLRCDVTIDQAYQAAKIIQQAYRCYRTKLAAKQLCSNIDWALASRRTIGILRDLPVPRWELDRAATLIKAAYKGYYTRRLMRSIVKNQALTSNTIDIIEGTTPPKYDQYPPTEAADAQIVDYDEIMNQIQEYAAVVIQRAFRSHLQKKKEAAEEQKIEMETFNEVTYVSDQMEQELNENFEE